MIINCKNILLLPYANQLRMVAGENGKNNMIRDVHVVEEMSLLEFVAPDELILCMGCTFSEGIKEWEYLIEEIYERKAAGLVICLGIRLKTTPQELIDLCDNLEFPLFELRREIRISNVIHSIYRAMFQEEMASQESLQFFDRIIEQKIRCSPKRIQQAEQYGFHDRTEYDMAAIRVMDYNYQLVDVKKEVETVCEYDYLDRVKDMLQTFASSRRDDAVIFQKTPHIIMLLPKTPGSNREFLKEIAGYFDGEGIDIKIAAGVQVKGLDQLPGAYEKLIRIVHQFENSTEQILYYEDMKLSTILYELQNDRLLTEIAGTSLHKLFENEKGEMLYETLEEYLLQDCSIQRAAEALFIHQNTLRYRLERIENVLGISLKEFHNLYNLRMAVEIYRHINK